MPWLQKKRKRKLRRICPLCGKEFYCNGACKDSLIINNPSHCVCPEHFDIAKDIRKSYLAYKNLSYEEIFEKCYGDSNG